MTLRVLFLSWLSFPAEEFDFLILSNRKERYLL